MVDEMPKENPEKEAPSQLDSLKRKVKDLHGNPKVHGIKNFLVRHTREVVSGIFVLLGIISSFFSWVGGLFVACGVVLGFYPEIRLALGKVKVYYAANGPVKNAILSGLLLFFLLHLFPFTLSFLVLCLILVLLVDDRKSDSKPE